MATIPKRLFDELIQDVPLASGSIFSELVDPPIHEVDYAEIEARVMVAFGEDFSVPWEQLERQSAQERATALEYQMRVMAARFEQVLVQGVLATIASPASNQTSPTALMLENKDLS